MRFRTFNFQLVPLFGLISLALPLSCATDQASKATAVINPNTSLDTGDSPYADLDQSVQDLIAQGERYDYWVEQMDPYISENTDWTYSSDWQGFIVSTQDEHLEVYEHYMNAGPATADTVIIDELVNGLPIVNQYALEQYQEMIAGGGGVAPPSAYANWYWWGYRMCYTGSDATNAKYALCASAIPAGFVNPIAAAYLGMLCVNADWLISRCPTSGFCLKQLWNGFTWTSCP